MPAPCGITHMVSPGPGVGHVMPLTHETMPAGPDALLTVRPFGTGLIVMVAGAGALWPTASVAVTVAVVVAAALGVPVMVPSVARVRPLGSRPAVIDQVYGSAPPCAVREAL